MDIDGLIDRLTAGEMAEISGLPLELIESRLKGDPDKEGRWALDPAYVAPSGEGEWDGLFTMKELCRRFGVGESTVRKRIQGITPLYRLRRSYRALYKMTPRLMMSLDVPLERDTHHKGEEGGRNFLKSCDKSVASLVREEAEKKAWVGRMGVLLNDKGAVVTRGKIETVSCCGVFVNGIMGQMKNLRLEEQWLQKNNG